MYNNATEIIQAYGKGEITLEEANEMLKSYNLYIDPNKNKITNEEWDAAIVDPKNPEKTTGYGRMYHGVGGPEKMYVKNGKFEYDTGFYIGSSVTFYIKGVKFMVNGDHIESTDQTNIREEEKIVKEVE